MTVFSGLHHPGDARHFPRAMISVNTIRNRKGGFAVGEWMIDSGACTEIRKHGGYPHPPEDYAAESLRWSTNGHLLCAVSQDFMCKPAMLQRLTIERYDRIRAAVPSHIQILPVLQGYAPEEYVEHIRRYGDRPSPGMWAGVGSVCKRNGKPEAIEAVLRAIKQVRPDPRLHGFGLKVTALGKAYVRGTWRVATAWRGRSGREWTVARGTIGMRCWTIARRSRNGWRHEGAAG